MGMPHFQSSCNLSLTLLPSLPILAIHERSPGNVSKTASKEFMYTLHHELFSPLFIANDCHCAISGPAKICFDGPTKIFP